MTDCILCEVIKSREAVILYESTHVLCIFDLYPATKGHLLIFPKSHIERLHLIDDDPLQNDLFDTLVTVCKWLVESQLCTDYNIVQCNGPLADQEIQHVHFHVIPRYVEDGIVIDLNEHAERADRKTLQSIGSLITRTKHQKTGPSR
ncbi:HIT family protein [Paenibacillus macerans]|uniref:HIT family protein n=1 Tax=Paenibacillus macerans TaxID=44252 RepID=UPI003D31ACA8